MDSINRGLKSFVNKLFLKKKFNNIFMRNINKNFKKKIFQKHKLLLPFTIKVSRSIFIKNFLNKIFNLLPFHNV